MSELPQAVEAIGQIHFEGNVIPHSWFDCPLLKTPSGRPNTVAIILLADIVYWYRPVKLKDEMSGQEIPARKKFAEDKLQKHYDKWGESFGFTKRQTQEACYALREAGLITIEARTVEVNGRIMNNVMYFEPIPEAIKAITFRRSSSHIRMEEVSHPTGIPRPLHRETYTENRLEITNTESFPLNVSASATTNGNDLAYMRQRAVDAAVSVTGDAKSRRRFVQLFGICEESGNMAEWDAALDAIRRRLRDTDSPVERPGAYFGKLLADRLLERGVSVPVGSKAEREEVARAVRESLG